MHNCKKRVVQCLNVSFITVAQFLTDVIHVSLLKFGTHNDNLNGTNLKIDVLKSVQSRPGIRMVMRCIFDPTSTLAEITYKNIFGDSTDFSHG